MTRRLMNPLPPEVLAAQRDAADPETSAWVDANAGSGKTHVLTQRVLRLLLTGVRPEDVLCLTYTRAAAAEMRRRVSQRLAAWALMAEDELRHALDELTGTPPPADRLQRARTLFAHALDTPGGLKIQTIHAFCEGILHRFPTEAGVPFDFVVLEDFERQDMILKAREQVIASGLRGGALAEPVEVLFGHLSDFSIREAIEEALAKARPLRRVLADREGAKMRLRDLVGHSGGRSSAAIRTAIERESVLMADDCRTLVRRLGGDSGKTRGARFADVLARADLDHPSSDDLIEAFTTAEGAARTTLVAAKDRPLLDADLLTRFERERDRIGTLHAELTRARLVERSEALLDILSAILDAYEAAKRVRSLLDFDDLVGAATRLLADEGLGAWVRFKLDTGITHILVDESQDTNEEQWALVKLLSDEFFAGQSAAERPRTVFGVGDGKQSIFSFQGAQPELFGRSGEEFEARALAAEVRFARLPLETSFRSLPNILAAVDAVFADPERQAAVLAAQPVRHQTARADMGGTVTLWAPLTNGDDGPSQGDGKGVDRDWPLAPPDVMARAPRRVARRIAGEIASWVREARPLGPRGRGVRPEDVLILVQTRAALFHELIRALAEAGLPTPGADRLMVTSHIAVLDLMALGDVLLNTADDLQLAALLRSPLFDVSEDALGRLASGRRGSLWRVLSETDIPSAAEAYRQLSAWRGGLDAGRPYEFFADVLYAGDGLRRFHNRFGSEVDDLFAEFLDLALEHEQSENPSLQGFLSSMRAREVMITRELSGASRGVRVMTVHGAKGLEAPIVILADAISKPAGRQLVKPVIVDAQAGLFVHASRETDHVDETRPLRRREEAAQWREYWRKLYVGMTRAEDELYLTGALGRRGTPDGSWYDAVLRSLAPHAEAVGDALIYPRQRPAAAPLSGARAIEAAAAPLVLPPLPAHRPLELVRPSSAFAPADSGRVLDRAAEAAIDTGQARQRGSALHVLLQHLPDVPASDRPRVAARAAAALLPEDTDAQAEVAAKAIGILAAPKFARLFGPDSRAEVPFIIDGQRRGTPIRLTGRIDRLVLGTDRVLVVDFKSDASAPPNAASVPPAYVTQLGLYALFARQLFPKRPVEAAILWSSPEILMFLPARALLEAAQGFTMA